MGRMGWGGEGWFVREFELLRFNEFSDGSSLRFALLVPPPLEEGLEGGEGGTAGWRALGGGGAEIDRGRSARHTDCFHDLLEPSVTTSPRACREVYG